MRQKSATDADSAYLRQEKRSERLRMDERRLVGTQRTAKRPIGARYVLHPGNSSSKSLGSKDLGELSELGVMVTPCVRPSTH